MRPRCEAEIPSQPEDPSHWHYSWVAWAERGQPEWRRVVCVCEGSGWAY